MDKNKRRFSTDITGLCSNCCNYGDCRGESP